MSFLKELSEKKQAITLYKYNGNDLKVDPNIEISKNTKNTGKRKTYISLFLSILLF